MKRIVVGMMCIALGVLVGSHGSAVAQTPNPVEIPDPQDNKRCSDFAPGTWLELKVDPVTNGQHTDGTLTVTITLGTSPQGQTFDWTSNIGVDMVFAKGGESGNLYTYSPEATSGTGLHAPLNLTNGMYSDLSHVTFCYDTGDTTTTTTTTTTSTTTTTQPPSGPLQTTTSTTSTTVPSGAPLASTTTAAMIGSSPTSAPPGATPTTKPGPTLPATGSGTATRLIISGSLLAVGVALLATARRARAS